MARTDTRTGGRDATQGVIPGDICLSVGKPAMTEPDGFAWTPLAEMARLESGHTPSRSNPGYWDGDIPWIGIRDATGNHGRRLMDTEQHVTQLGIDNSSARVLPPDTVCLSRTASVGFVVTMGVPMATSQDFVNWVCGPDLNHRYLHFALLLEQRAVRERFAHGSTHQTMYYPEAKALHLLTPPRTVQDAIAELLGALDDKIAANERIVALASELGAATFRASAASNTEVLSDVATIVMGTSPTGETMNEDGRGVPFQQGVRDFGVRFPSDRVWTTAPIRYASPGDVLLSVRAPVGRTNVADKDMCIGRGLAAIRSRRGTPWTLFHALSSVPDVWEPFEAGGTVFGSINKSQLASLEVPAVEGLVSALEARLAPLEERIAVAERESQKLADLRDALLPELMSGRLRVKDAEKTVEEVV